MFEQFSSGYYLGRLYVQAHDGSRAVLRESHHRQVREQLYRSSSDDAPVRPTASDGTDLPLVMRYQRQHFVVEGDDDIPEQTLVIPREWLADRPDPLEPHEVFLAKADRARQLLQFAVGVEAPDATGDGGPPPGGDGGSKGDDSGGGSHHGGGRPPGNPFTPGALSDLARPTRRQ
ncbi:MAG: DUF5802 family protein [Haloferacaceae archaeon]